MEIYKGECLVIALLISILISAFVAVHASNYPNKCEAQTQTDQRAHTEEINETLWCPSTWSPTTFFTGMLALSTTGLWFFTALLWWSTSKAVIDGEKSITSAISAAAAANKSADVAERALTGLERPIIILNIIKTGVSVDSRADVFPFGNLVSSLENIGRSPAIIVEHYDRVLICRKGTYPDMIDLDNVPIGVGTHKKMDDGVYIKSDNQIKITEDMNLISKTDPLWNSFSINSGHRDNLFIIGFVRYKSIFEKKYISGYCAVFNVASQEFTRIGGPGRNYIREEQKKV